MGLILRTNQTNLPPDVAVQKTRLTNVQMDNNFLYLHSLAGATGSGEQGPIGEQGPVGATGSKGATGAPGPNGVAELALVTLTVASASQYMSEGWITIGQPYLITDSDPNLYGTSSVFGFGEGTNILLYGVDENNFSSNGYGKFYNPIYHDFDVFNPGVTYSVDDKVIYGGKVWNLTGTASVGSDGYWDLQSDWEVLDYTDTTYYDVVWDEIDYNIVDNYITSRYDVINNNKVSDRYNTIYFYCEVRPIQSFRWGHSNVRNCKVENSYFGCLNFVSGSIYHVQLNNSSVIGDIQLLNGAYLETITLSNYSELGSFSIDGGHITNLTINNGSKLRNFSLYGNSYLETITLNNNSSIEQFILDGNSYFSGIKLESDCQIVEIALVNSSYFNDISLTNDSYIIVMGASASYLQNINITNESGIGAGLIMENADIRMMELTNNGLFIGEGVTPTGPQGDGNITITDSNLQNIKISNNSIFTGPISITGSSIAQLYMENSYIGGYEQDSESLYSITIDNSNLENLMLEGHSYIANLEIHSSTFSNTKLSNYSKITSTDDSIYIDDSQLDFINLSNHSEMGGYLNITNSNFKHIELNTSFLGGSSYDFNITDSTFQYVNLSNGSWFKSDDDNIDINSSTIEYINLTNGSHIDGNLEINSSYLGYLDLTNNSYFGYGIHVNNDGVLKQVKIENNSRLVGYDENDDIYVYQNSIMQNIEITNNSYLSGYMDLGEGSFFQNVKIDNDSHIYGTIYLYAWDNGYNNQGSTFENVTVTNGSAINGLIALGNNNANENCYGYLGNVTITNGSILGGSNVSVQYEARLEYITINNYSRFNKVYLTGKDINTNKPSKMSYIDINNYSYIDVNELQLLDGSEIKYLNLDNHSHIMGSTYLYDASKIKRVEMANYSKIDGSNYLYNTSEIQYLSMLNVSDNSGTSCYGSGFTNFYLSGTSSIHGLDMKWSTVGGLEVSNNSRIQGLVIENNSGVFNVELSGTSSILNSKIINSYLDGDYVDTNKYGSLLLNNGSWIENVIFDTVDFPTWDASHFGISLDNASTIRNMVLRNMCATDRVAAFLNNWDNRRGLVEDIYLNNSYLENITIDNSGETEDIFEGRLRLLNLSGGFISSVDAKYAQIEDITLGTASNIVNLKIQLDGLYDLYLGEGSYISDLEIINGYGSFYTNNLTYGSSIDGLKLDNSFFNNNNFNSSYLFNGDLSLSRINNCDIISSNLRNFNLSGTEIYNLDQNSVGNSFTNFDLKNQSFNFNSDSANTYSLNSTIGHNNTIKHQFSYNLAGLGNGTIPIPRYAVPGSGWYIEKAVIDSTPLIVSGTVSFSLGLDVSQPESVLNDVDSSVLSNSVKVYEIANGGTNGAKSTGFDYIGLFLNAGSNTITSGTMSMEITLKNTNYNTTWWD